MPVGLQDSSGIAGIEDMLTIYISERNGTFEKIDKALALLKELRDLEQRISNFEQDSQDI